MMKTSEKTATPADLEIEKRRHCEHLGNAPHFGSMCSVRFTLRAHEHLAPSKSVAYRRARRLIR